MKERFNLYAIVPHTTQNNLYERNFLSSCPGRGGGVDYKTIKSWIRAVKMEMTALCSNEIKWKTDKNIDSKETDIRSKSFNGPFCDSVYLNPQNLNFHICTMKIYSFEILGILKFGLQWDFWRLKMVLLLSPHQWIW